MLNDWERQQWAVIEHGLVSDRELARRVGASARARHSVSGVWLLLYPSLYLGTSVTYMLLSLGGAGSVLGNVALICTLGWVGYELWEARKKRRSAGARRSAEGR